ncbi:amidase [Natronorubrum sp. FCH18a]|uniref:amidase n=1 Tax=Natronorubrum sp. FCH18a TaxID=3447018 RepID=UPI003F50F65B
MRKPSAAELREIGAGYRIDFDDEDADHIESLVGDMLEGLDEIDDLPIEEGTSGGDRSWREPTENPHNEIVHHCDVPPVPDADGPIVGMEIGLKDNIAVAGVPLTGGSELLQSLIPRIDATVVSRLREAGARITAKTNLDEYAGGGRAVSYLGDITNPYDTDRIAGGSSGGSAVAVATGRVDAALGSDTGGSCRMPAAMCGIVGLKPTYGLVPLSGVIENTYTLDHVGPMTPDVDTAGRVLAAIAGRDSSDAASMAAAGRPDYLVGDYVDAVESPPDPTDLTIGVLEDGFGDGVTQPVEEQTRETIATLSEAGFDVVDVSVDTFEYVDTIKNILSYTELATHWRSGAVPLRRNSTIDTGYQTGFAKLTAHSSANANPFYRSRLLAGAHLLEEHYGRPYTRAQRAQALVDEELEAALADVDVLALPTLPDIAPRIENATNPERPPVRNCRLANVTGAPAITLPHGTVDGVPIGLQLVAGSFDDAALLGVARTVEKTIDVDLSP